MSLAADIRKAARRLETFRVRDIALLVGGSYNAVRAAVYDQMRAGNLRRIAPGLYAAVDRKEPAPRPNQRQLWHLMKMQQAGFSVAELAVLSELSRDYVKKYVIFLKKAGHIREVGKVRHLNGRNIVPQYAVAAASRRLPAPAYRRRRSQNDKKENARKQALDAACEAAAAIRAGKIKEAKKQAADLEAALRAL